MFYIETLFNLDKDEVKRETKEAERRVKERYLANRREEEEANKQKRVMGKKETLGISDNGSYVTRCA